MLKNKNPDKWAAKIMKVLTWKDIQTPPKDRRHVSFDDSPTLLSSS